MITFNAIETIIATIAKLKNTATTASLNEGLSIGTSIAKLLEIRKVQFLPEIGTVPVDHCKAEALILKLV